MSAALGTWGAVTSGGPPGAWSSWTSVRREPSGQRQGGPRPGLGEDEVPVGKPVRSHALVQRGGGGVAALTGWCRAPD